MGHRLSKIATRSFAVGVVACSGRTSVGPTSTGTLDQFLQSLRQQGLSVSLGGEIPPDVNRFFSVPARQVRVNDTQVNAFEYASGETAAAEAAMISPDGQPNPQARITWISTPRFYRHDRLIVLYVGCSADILHALQATVGPPIAAGPTPCDVGR
jgi:hypothetical protein